MNVLIITNNDLLYNKYKDSFEIEFLADAEYKRVLEVARDHIHKGYALLSHPMAGSVKPNQTPYRSIVLDKRESVDFESVKLIESSIQSLDKFFKFKTLPAWTESIKEDFKVVDMSFIESGLSRNTQFKQL